MFYLLTIEILNTSLSIIQVSGKKKTTIKKTKETEKKDSKGRGITVDGITDYKWEFCTYQYMPYQMSNEMFIDSRTHDIASKFFALSFCKELIFLNLIIYVK